MNPKSTTIFAAALATGVACASPALAQLLVSEVPAVYRGGATCPTKFPGSFLDIGTAACWQCPSTHPRRTIFPVTAGNACERPAYEAFKRASGPENPTGFLRTDCRSGWFLDIGKGKCYSCAGYNRTAYPIDHARACSKAIPAAWTSAARMGVEGCPAGSFRNGVTGYCYACPPDYTRNAVIADDLTKVNACSRIPDAVREAARAKFEEAKATYTTARDHLIRIASSATIYDAGLAAFDLLSRELMKTALDSAVQGLGGFTPLRFNTISWLASAGGAVGLGYTHGQGYVMTKVDGNYQCRKAWSNTFTGGVSAGLGAAIEIGLSNGMDEGPSESNGWQVAAGAAGWGLHWDATDGAFDNVALSFGPGFGADVNFSEYVHDWSEIGKVVACDKMTWGLGWAAL